VKHLLSYRYSEEDDAFYDRALANYEPEYGEPNPGRWPDKPQNGVPLDAVGPVVRRLFAGQRVVEGVRGSYDRERLAEIQLKGKEDPRKLTFEETRLASKNRVQAREDYRVFDMQTAELRTGES